MPSKACWVRRAARTGPPPHTHSAAFALGRGSGPSSWYPGGGVLQPWQFQEATEVPVRHPVPAVFIHSVRLILGPGRQRLRPGSRVPGLRQGHGAAGPFESNLFASPGSAAAASLRIGSGGRAWPPPGWVPWTLLPFLPHLLPRGPEQGSSSRLAAAGPHRHADAQGPALGGPWLPSAVAVLKLVIVFEPGQLLTGHRPCRFWRWS